MAMPPPNVLPASSLATRTEQVAALAQQLRDLEGQRFGRDSSGGLVSSGLTALDRLLPAGGFRRGTLVEWLEEPPPGESRSASTGSMGPTSPGQASGAGTLALLAARTALQQGGALLVIDRTRRFYPPAALAWGLALESLIVVHPTSRADEAWAVDQSLRCHGVAAVWLALETADEHTLRRWQLAAESSGTLGLLVRGSSARSEPSWAELRLGVQPLPKSTALPQSAPDRTRHVRVELLRARSAPAGASVEVELPARAAPRPAWSLNTTEDSPRRRGASHETGTLHLASSVAPATHRRARRA